jgi:hypothetical protein
MSLKSIDVKKNIEVVTREFLINSTLRRVHDFMLSVILDFFIQGTGEMRRIVSQVNMDLPKLATGIKFIKVWIRDIMNNYIWTYDSDNLQYENLDLTQLENS